MPVIWLIDAYRAGERGQVRALVDALGWPCETKVLRYRTPMFLPHILGLSTLCGIKVESRPQLRAPWPDLVISCGVRNEPVCRWIRAQSKGKTRYVHVGRPWAALDTFDLIITTPQYRVPAQANVLNNMLTLHSVTPQRLAEARADWGATFTDLPRPHFAVIVGGDSGPFTLGPKAAERLGRQASRLARAQGGSLLVSTSSRTGATVMDALQSAITAPSYLYRFKSEDPANPYLGILALADRFIVTGDSIAMLSEACATGKPVMVFDLGGMRDSQDKGNRDFRLGGALYALLLRWLWRPLSRDITLVHEKLHDAGYVVWMDEVLVGARLPARTDMQQAVAAVQKLFAEV
jgi:mitochondrial fission protein ELM1